MIDPIMLKAVNNLKTVAETIKFSDDDSSLEVGELNIETLQDFRLMSSLIISALSLIAERYENLEDPNFKNVMPEGVEDDGEERKLLNSEDILNATLIDALFMQTAIKKGSNGLTATINNYLTDNQDVFASFRVMTKEEVINSRDGFMNLVKKQNPKLSVVPKSDNK